MTATPYPLNFIVPLESIAEFNKAPILNADIEVNVRRLSNNQYWTGTGITFQAAPTQIPLTEISETNSPGVWARPFDTTGLPKDTYVSTFTDVSGNADNYPQYSEAIVGEGSMELAELAAAGAIGRAVYDEVVSTLTLYRWDDPAKISQVFDCKDKDGNPSGLLEIFEKIPQ